MSRVTAGRWIVVALVAVRVALPPAAHAGFKPDDLEAHVSYLASDKLAGRETGAPGIRRAEKYVAQSFRRSGLKPLPGRDGFFAGITLYRGDYDPEATTLELTVGGETRRVRLGDGFRPFGFSDEGTVTAPVVFAGYGITAEEYGYDDYAGLDVEGKVVLLLRHEPNEKDPESPFDGNASTGHANFTTKAKNAADHGAVGMLLFTDPLNHDDADDMRNTGRLSIDPPGDDDVSTAESETTPFLALQISRSLASFLLEPGGLAPAELQRRIDAGERPAQLEVPHAVAGLGVRETDQAEAVPARNVIGFLEGSDPVLKEEWVVIGGHHDHVGAYPGDGDTIYNGADDNASGTTGVLELAREFASRSERPKRSIVFATFTAEEKGLLGSRVLVRDGLIPMDKVVFMLNLDMIGRNPDRRLQVFGDGYARGLRELVEVVNRAAGLQLDFAGAGYAGNSDHDSFYKSDVPFMFFFTGTHEDYHQPGDHAVKLDYERMASILELAAGVIGRIADAGIPPIFIHHVSWLGLRVEVVESDGDAAAVVTGVADGSRAAGAGVDIGDVLTGFDGESLDDPAQVGARFREIEPGTVTELALMRRDEEIRVSVERAKTGYMGIGPGRIDDDVRKQFGLGHQEGVRLNTVLPDGPSDEAGLVTGDIMIGIAGRPVGEMNLRQELTSIGAGETVGITVIRDGERMTIPVTLGERPER